MKTISDKIFELLKEKGMSQKEFAQRTGIAERYRQNVPTIPKKYYGYKTELFLDNLREHKHLSKYLCSTVCL